MIYPDRIRELGRVDTIPKEKERKQYISREQAELLYASRLSIWDENENEDWDDGIMDEGGEDTLLLYPEEYNRALSILEGSTAETSDRKRLRAFLEGLEVQHIDYLLDNADAEDLRKLGETMAERAKEIKDFGRPLSDDVRQSSTEGG